MSTSDTPSAHGSDPFATLPLTGERTVPGIPGERYWFHRHEAAYAWVANTLLRPGDIVLEAGAGEGYGAELLRLSGAARVIAIDYDPFTVSHIRSRYPHIDAYEGNLVEIATPDDLFTLVVSMQVIEHLWDVRAFLREVARVARPGARVVLSTPNRPVFSPGLARNEKPLNPFHVEEFDAEQLRDLLVECGLTSVQVHGLHHAQRISAFEATNGPIVPRLVELDPQDMTDWPADLSEIVVHCTAADFAITDDTDDAHDLIVVATAP